MEEKEKGHEASTVVEPPGGNRQRVVGGVELPRGIYTPGVEGYPQGEKNSRVTIEGNRVPGADRRGRGADKNSLATRDTEGGVATRQAVAMASGQGPAAALRLLRNGAERESGSGGQAITQSHSAGSTGTSPEHDTSREYGILAPEGSAGDTSDVGPLGRGGGIRRPRR